MYLCIMIGISYRLYVFDEIFPAHWMKPLANAKRVHDEDEAVNIIIADDEDKLVLMVLLPRDNSAL